ncbi:sulfotransferase, putative [Ixodes scapularis]|uniref:Sulfotransferase, putative n=1 Tax=Ixodes scapularis TaxID=6945 RepID=B7PWD5_IXOSC|nr:sulfotransferase, putative [Ixodes scapularis]|eukprot:XP_002409688.1 sulfotransferase, putative [Ixodes scapularis]
MSPQVYRYVEGLYNSVYFIDENLRSALKYRPQPNDLFIVSYPKCGTTWLQYLVYNIFTEGVPPQDMEEFLARSVFLEYTGAQSVEKMCRPGSIKTHFPFSRHPYSKLAKYLYIARNPYDCCVSFYYHTKSFPAYFFENGTFSEFFDMFLQGKVDNGDYFNNLLSWYDHRHDPNVLFLTYECLKRDTESWVIKIADFIGKEYGAKLRRDADAVKKIIQMSSMETMRKVFSRSHDILDEAGLSVYKNSKNPSQPLEESVLNAMKKPMSGDYIRKGIVGDWKNHFSKEQVVRMKSWIALRTAGSDVMKLWRDEDLP